ncbi:hypothetical protein PRIEUP_LOCUS16321, partial [Pristimantis euphronides]
ISDLFEQLEAAAGTADPRWLQARWARVLEAARPLTPEGGPAAPQEESAAPGPLALESPAGVVGSLRRSQRARVPSGRARDGPQSAGGKRRSPSGAPPARVRSIVVPLHGARAGRNPSTRPRPAGERGEASPHPAPSSSLGRRAAVRSTAVGRPGDVPAGGSTRRRETTRAESAGKRSRPQSAGARRRSRGGDVRRRSRCSGRAARAQRESSESSGTGVSTDESSETAAGVPGTSEDPSSADESADGRGGAAEGPAGPSQPERTPGLVWILGHSYVYWGAQLADRRREGRQLGIGKEVARVRWIGVRGLRWGRILGEIHRFVQLDGRPDVLVLHAGGNDIGNRPCRELARDIKHDILRLWKLYPKLVVVWSEVVRRKIWRNARSVERLDKARIKVNRMVSAFVTRNGGVAVRHRELEEAGESYWRPDGVHLTEVGLAFWLLDIQQGVERAVELWRASHS